MTLIAHRSSMVLFSDPKDHRSHQVRMVLAEKSVSFDVIDPHKEGLQEDLAEVNPYNTLPTLLDRDLVLYQADIIMEYLDERFPHPPLLPVYPVHRARSRLWMYRVEREWSRKLDELLRPGVEDAAAAAARAELRESLISTVPVFAEMPFFMNEEFTLVDCCVAPILWRMKAVGIPLRERAAKPLRSYMEKLFHRESFRRSLTEAEIEMRE